MGINLDTKERTKKREAAAVDAYAANLDRLKQIRLYTLTELEPLLQVTHRTLLTYIKDGRLKGVKIGGKWRISEDNLKKFINGEE